MSLALQFGDGSSSEEMSALYYINVVQNYVKDTKGTLSKHPLDSGVRIGDHFTADNMTFQIKGVITSADITFAAYTTSFSATGQNNLQQTSPPMAIQIEDGESSLNKVLPDAIGQFLSPLEPTIIGETTEVVEYGISFSEFIEKMILEVIYNRETGVFRNSIVPVTLYEMEGNNYFKKAPYTNLVVTSFRVTETPDTGNGCHFDMTLEQTRAVELVRGEYPVDVGEETEDKGKADSTEEPVTEEEVEAAQVSQLKVLTTRDKRVNLPLHKEKDYSYSVVLDGVATEVRLFYTEASDGWFMDLKEEGADYFVRGMRIVPDYPMTLDYPTVPLKGYFLLESIGNSNHKFKEDAANLHKWFKFSFIRT